jgi:hypothetical protein
MPDYVNCNLLHVFFVIVTLPLQVLVPSVAVKLYVPIGKVKVATPFSPQVGAELKSNEICLIVLPIVTFVRLQPQEGACQKTISPTAAFTENDLEDSDFLFPFFEIASSLIE